jgi:hypothetical protein
MDDRLLQRLKELGIDLERLKRCWAKHCRPNAPEPVIR